MSRTPLGQLIARSLESPDFRRAFVQVSEETATRPVRPCKCVVVEIPETADRDAFADISPGTVTVFVARDDEPLLRKLLEGLEARDSKGVNSVTGQIKRTGAQIFDKITKSMLDSEAAPRALPSFAEISYANKSLIGHLYVDEVLRVHAHPLTYNGGQLDRSRFTAMEFYRTERDTPLTCVLVVRKPQLSEIEKEALRLVPGGSANNLAKSPCEPLTPALLAIVVAATPYAAQWLVNEFVCWLMHGVVALSAIPDEVIGSKEFAEKLRSLPPEATAAELLRLRTEVLLRTPAQ